MLVKSTPMKEGEEVLITFGNSGKDFSYTIPEGYKGVLHFVIDLYPARQKVIFAPGSQSPKF